MYNIEGIEWFVKMVREFAGKNVCELGNQHIWEHAARHVGTIHTVARDWILDLGANVYASIDMSGQDGAMKIDLSGPVPDALHDTFDVVTNIGASEHVMGDGDSLTLAAQWECFANMHRMCREGGLMIHQVSPVGFWGDHCSVRYKPGFPVALSRACHSTLVASEMVRLSTLNPNECLLMFAIMKQGNTMYADADMLAEIEISNV